MPHRTLWNLAITLVEAPNPGHPDESAWRRFQISDDGSISGEAQIGPDSFQVSDGRIVSTPTSDGYLLAWQNNTTNGGTYFASLTPPPPDAGPDATDNVTSHSVLASARPMAAIRACPSWAGSPRLGTSSPSGWQGRGGRGRTIRRLRRPQGRALYLPSVSGNTGPVSAWVGNDAVYVTYLDMPGSSTPGDAAVPTGNQRYLVTVLSPAESYISTAMLHRLT